MQPPIKEALPIFTGKESEIFCPDTRTVRVRETNGNDDSNLSRLSEAESGESLINFLADIVLWDSKLNRKPLAGDILNWPINTRTYTLFKQRILNHGPLMTFKKTCPDSKCKLETTYEVDIQEDHDNDLNEPKPGRNRIQLYPKGSEEVIEFTISSGKRLRFFIMTGVLEKASLDMPRDTQDQNTKLILRRLQIFNADQWISVTSFHGFSSREMGEIRAYVEKYDPQFMSDVHVTSPKCKLQDSVPLLFIPDFYFPVPQI